MRLAGKDATEEYDPIHPPGVLEETLPSSAMLGEVDPSTHPAKESNKQKTKAESSQISPLPDLDALLNLADIEQAATSLISRKAWAYYYSASDDLLSKSMNNTVYRSILLRPRIFVDCTKCSTSSTVLGRGVGLPIFVSPAAMARLAHPDGERGIAQACAKYGIVQIISNNASMTPEQIVANAPDGQVFGWQLYVQTDRAKSEAMLARINNLPQIKFVVLTLDAPVPGKREHDERMKNIASSLPVRSAVQSDTSGSSTKPEGKQSGGIGASLFAGTAPDLKWEPTLSWLAKHTSLPIVLKGVQTHEDAQIAVTYRRQVKGIILSNHGGRAADTAPPSIHTLMEIRKFCPGVLQRIDVFVDGGIQRGTDVVKALCLGARAVGIGRAPLWGLGVGGTAGVERVFESKSTDAPLPHFGWPGLTVSQSLRQKLRRVCDFLVSSAWIN